NTVVFRDGRALGHNTDWSGFARSFDRGLADATLDRVVLLGAGGAGAAVAHALLTLGTGRLTIADVDARRARELAGSLGSRGCRVLDGGGMAVFQAVDAFKLFTGVEPDADRMLAHFAELIGDGARVG